MFYILDVARILVQEFKRIIILLCVLIAILAIMDQKKYQYHTGKDLFHVESVLQDVLAVQVQPHAQLVSAQL